MGEIPAFSIEGIDLAAIRAELDIPEVDETQETPFIEAPPKRRHRNAKLRRSSTVDDEPETPAFDIPAKLTKRDEREVNERLQKIMLGATGMLGMAKPYLEMTDEEAAAICEPLSSYLVRNADTIPVARQVLENYDLLAITLGVMAYVVRVYRDRREEVEEYRASKPTLAERVGSATESPQTRSEVRTGSIFPSSDGVSVGYAPEV